MKFFHLLILITTSVFIISCGAMSSANLSSDDPRYLEKIVEFQNKSADDLFVAFNTWMANYFNSAESVIDYSDKEAGKVVGKYVFEFKSGIYYYNGKSTMNIDVKDGRVKFLFNTPLTQTNGDTLNGKGNYTNSYTPVEKVDFMQIFKEEWNEVISDAVEHVSSSSNDW